jgi:hypothetical protein
MTASKKKYLLGMLTLSAVFIGGFNIWRYLTDTYFPLKDARPIIEKLSSGDEIEIRDATFAIRGRTLVDFPNGSRRSIPLEDHKPLRGAGEEKVRHLLLDMLGTTTNRNVLSAILEMCTTGEGLDLANTRRARGQSDKTIIMFA